MGTPSESGDAANAKEQRPPPTLDADGSISKEDAKSGDKSRNRRKKAQVPVVSRNVKYALRSSCSNVRVLRSRTHDGKKEPPTPPVLPPPSSAGSMKGRRRRRRKKKNDEVKGGVDDELAKMRYRVAYYLRRMNYEQSLVDAYAAEGWKGQSLEKIRPEKELERAKSEITRCKLKIRDLFRQFDSLLSEGRFDDSIFDSDGQIDSDDIFCAKCGSKDLSVGNDIILCDGACNRGFHQKCLTPPLLNENIPAGDEGWLCHGCDCKVECIDLLNELHGTDLSIEDEWESIFPEAAAIADKNNLYDDMGLPSDDSEDEDFAPDDSKVDDDHDHDDDNENDEKDNESSSSSEDSDYASDGSDIPIKDLPNGDLGLPSDDSEDDDYDPNKRDTKNRLNEDASGSVQGSSSFNESDFTSDSEGSSSPNINTEFTPIQPGRTTAKSSDIPSLHEELLSLNDPEIDHEKCVTSPDQKKRKNMVGNKLHNDAENGSSDSEDKDETWTGDVSKRLRHELAGKGSLRTKFKASKGSCKSMSKAHCDETSNQNANQSDTSDITLKNSTRRSRQKSQLEGMSLSGYTLDKKRSKETNTDTSDKYALFGSCIHNGKNSNTEKIQSAFPSPSSYSCKGLWSVNAGSGYSNRFFTKEVSQYDKLLESFTDNQYPTTLMKRKLAEDLGITYKQVQKWFVNARHSFRASANSHMQTRQNSQEAATSASARENLNCGKSNGVEELSPNCKGESLDATAVDDSPSNTLDPKAGCVLPSSGGKRSRAVVDREKLVLRELRKLKRGH